MEDKDILMIDALREINITLTLFSDDSSIILPDIIPDLNAKLREFQSLLKVFAQLLKPGGTNLINEGELQFTGKINEVILYAITKDQALVVPAVEQLNTYIREKIALVSTAARRAADSNKPE